MPYFSWKGVDIEGRLHKGKLFAQSTQELDAVLFKQEIALLGHAPIRQITFFSRISLDDKIQFFKQLADLLNAGVLLPDGLLVVASQTHQLKFQRVIDQISQQVHAGSSLSQVLGQQPSIFDPVMVHMVKVGEESSKLGSVLGMLADYLQMKSDFGQKLRSALLVPGITLGFFCCITILIFALIVPQFASMFQSVNQDLPQLTKTMLAISNFVRSSGMFYLIFTGSLLLFVFSGLLNRIKGTGIPARLILTIPILGVLIRQSSLGYFLQAVSMLLQGGMPLLPAIGVAKATVRNFFLAHNITIIEKEVQAGSSLSQAMIHNMTQIFSAEVIAIVRVGEESGHLAPLLARAAHTYQIKVQRTLSWIVTMINPLLMISLGVLITFLIMAVYVPIFNLSHIV